MGQLSRDRQHIRQLRDTTMEAKTTNQLSHFFQYYREIVFHFIADLWLRFAREGGRKWPEGVGESMIARKPAHWAFQTSSTCRWYLCCYWSIHFPNPLNPTSRLPRKGWTENTWNYLPYIHPLLISCVLVSDSYLWLFPWPFFEQWS